MSSIVVIMLAIIGGIAVTVQGQFMGSMTQIMGTKESVFITYVSGGIVVALFMLASGGNHLQSWRQVPGYALSAGLLGLVIVGTVGYVVPRLGVAAGFTIIVAAQFVAAALIDHFGWFGAAVRHIDPTRWLGLVLLLGGVWLMNRH